MANGFMLSSAICFLAFIYFFPTISLGQTSKKPENSTSPANTLVTKSITCTAVGDSDIYGLGVRIGLYLQWLSGFILRNIGSWDTVARVRTANNALCAALALAAAINIVDGKALSIDYLISYYLTVILFYSESYNLHLEAGGTAPQTKDTRPKPDSRGRRRSASEDSWIRRPTHYTLAPDLSLVSQNLFFTAWTLFGTWYWLAGINRTRKSPCTEDAAIVLLFSLHSHKWKTFATVFSIILGIFWAIVFVANSLGFVSTKGKKPGPIITAVFHHHRFFSGGMTQTPEPQQLGDQFKRPVWKNYFHYVWLYLLGPVVGIISVERIIAGNNLSTSNIKEGTGQMISLITGITSMLCALWELGIWLNMKILQKHGGNPSSLDTSGLQGAITSAPSPASICMNGTLRTPSDHLQISANPLVIPIPSKNPDHSKEGLLERRHTTA